MTEGLATRIRSYVDRAYIQPARNGGRTEICVTAGDVHRDLKLDNRMPAVCGALDAKKFADEFRVVVSRRTGPKFGSTAKWYLSIQS